MARFAWVAAGVVIGCGDNRTLPIDAPPPDAPRGAPELGLVPERMNSTAVIEEQLILPSSCELIEACVGGPGLRRLLKFDVILANRGDGDLVLGPPPPPGVSDATFTWSACHGHHHMLGVANYELRDTNGVVIGGHKQAFCLQDIEPVVQGAPSRRYNCGNQGISAGWADSYGHELPCQWIDITGVSAGDYTLRVQINPENTLPDTDPSNNEYLLPVSL